MSASRRKCALAEGDLQNGYRYFWKAVVRGREAGRYSDGAGNQGTAGSEGADGQPDGSIQFGHQPSADEAGADGGRTDGSGAMIIMDIDYFKQINDYLGHYTGIRY